MIFKLQNSNVINPELFHMLTIKKVPVFVPALQSQVGRYTLVGCIYTDTELYKYLCTYDTLEEAQEELDNIIDTVNSKLEGNKCIS
jgi:hypothetical protein